MREENEQLSHQFQQFQSIVMQFLPPDAHNIFEQNQQQNSHQEQ